MATVEEVHWAQRAGGMAMILAIGRATPPTCVDQSTYPDFYFHITNSEHKTELKEKFTRMCKNSSVKQRYMYLTEEILRQNPKMCSRTTATLDCRQDIMVAEVPKLGKEAADKAIEEWGQPLSKITHLVFCTIGGVSMPGADYQLANLLGLSPSVKRVMLYHQGCHGGGTVLRLAKDLAENHAGARVLVVCSEITVLTFHGPSDANVSQLVGQALFGDGAAAMIVGSDPIEGVEKPIFQLVMANQTFLPGTQGELYGQITENGIDFHLGKNIPNLLSDNINMTLKEALDPLGISDWNSIFWIVHPGGPAILNQIESKLGLKPEKLRWSRQTLSQYGNVLSVSVLFILDEMRKGSAKDGLGSTGEGLNWGVLFGFGPGLTVETVVLHSMPIN